MPPRIDFIRNAEDLQGEQRSELDMIHKLSDDYDKLGKDAVKFWEPVVPNPASRLSAVGVAHSMSLENLFGELVPLIDMDFAKKFPQIKSVNDIEEIAMAPVYRKVFLQMYVQVASVAHQYRECLTEEEMAIIDPAIEQATVERWKQRNEMYESQSNNNNS